MKEYNELSADMKVLLKKSEELGWWWNAWIEKGQNNRTYLEMGKHSPAGEDFSMIIDFEPENQAETLLENMWEYAYDFDVDDHVMMWAPKRGEGGCPFTIKELVEDAEAIVDMIKELYEELDKVMHPELSDEQSARCDEIYNAVYEMCKVVAGDEKLEWDMYYLGEIAELTANMMVNKGYRVRFPAIVTKEDGTQRIEEFFKPDQEEN